MKTTAALALAPMFAFLLLVVVADAQSFVSKKGTKFVYQGNSVTFYGSTFYPSPIGGTAAWHTTTFPSYIDLMIIRAQQAGQNILRPTDFWDKITPHQNPQDPVVWANMDYLVSASKKHGMFVLMDISAYKWLLTANGQNITDSNNWSSFIDFVAARYKNEPTVAFWSIMGEPAVPRTTAEADSLVAFYDAVTTRLRNDDPNHLICAGAFNHMEDHPELSWWQRIYSLSNNDIAGYKTYSQNDLNLMPSITNYTNSINKPAVDEEFGMPQSSGDCSWSGISYNGLNTDRADFFKNVYNEGLAGGVAGFQFWNMGDEVSSASYEVSPSFPCLWAVLQQYSPPAQPPQGLAASATSSSQINLAWSANVETTVTGYNIYRSTTSGFIPNSGNRIAGGVAATSYSDTGLSAATTYYYLVTAVNQLSKESSPSNQASAATQGATTTTMLTTSANPSRLGDSVTFAVTVAAADSGVLVPTGTVTFNDGVNPLGTATLNGSGQTSFPISTLTAGPHSITAAYGGDANFLPSASSFTQVVIAAAGNATTTTLTVNNGSPNAIYFGVAKGVQQKASFAVHVTGSSDNDSVLLMEANWQLGPLLTLSSGQASFDTQLSVGEHSVRAIYLGDNTAAGSVSSSVTVNRSPRPEPR